MSKNGSGPIITGFLALIAGGGTMLRTCSKADDVARLGKAANYAEDVRGLRYMDDTRSMRYADDISGTANDLNQLSKNRTNEFVKAVLENQYNQQSEKLTTSLYDEYLQYHSRGKYVEELKSLPKENTIPSSSKSVADSKAELIGKYETSETRIKREQIFKNIKTVIKLGDHLHKCSNLYKDMKENCSLVLSDTSVVFLDYTITIPAGSILFDKTNHVIWAIDSTINQITSVEKRETEQFGRSKNPSNVQDRYSSFIYDNYTYNLDGSYSFDKNFSSVYGNYKTIPKNNVTILLESIGSDSLVVNQILEKIKVGLK